MIKIYTDGSCLKNPGNGGWAAIININDKIKNLELETKDLSKSVKRLIRKKGKNK